METLSERVARLRPPLQRPGPRQRVVCCRILETQAAGLRALAAEAGLNLNAYLRALLISHLEELGGGTSAQDGR